MHLIPTKIQIIKSILNWALKLVVPLWTEHTMTLCGTVVRRNWRQPHALPWVKPSASQIQITANFLRNLNSAQLLPEIYRVKAKRQNKTRNLYFTTIIGFPFLPYWHLNKEQKLGYSLQDISKSFRGIWKIGEDLHIPSPEFRLRCRIFTETGKLRVEHPRDSEAPGVWVASQMVFSKLKNLKNSGALLKPSLSQSKRTL